MKKWILSPVVCLVILSGLSSQSMLFYADAMINADLAKHRRFAAAQFEPMFMNSLEDDLSFEVPLSDFKWLIVTYAPDSSFRTVSWQVDLGNSKFSYCGIIQTESGLLFPFSKERGDLTKNLKRSVSWNNWQGGIIYEITNVDSSTYTLLTFRQVDQFTKLKTAEILYFNEGSPELGKPLFQMKEGEKDYAYRLVLEYSSDSNLSLSYYPSSKQLVFDNLIQVVGRLPGQGPAMVSDGSYKAYVLENGQWQLIDKLYNEVLLTAPRAQREKNKDLFGRTKNKSK